MQFTVSHSRLVLRGFGDSREDFIDVEFIGVDRMELSRVMSGGIVLRTVETHEGYRCTCRELRTCSSSGMSILVDDTTQTVPPAYGQALDLVGLKGLGPGSQGCCSGK
jgi:hypothetical protein